MNHNKFPVPEQVKSLWEIKSKWQNFLTIFSLAIFSAVFTFLILSMVISDVLLIVLRYYLPKITPKQQRQSYIENPKAKLK